MRINHNIASLNTYRQLSTNGAQTSKSLEKLSSGLRINKAGDDAAGLAISEKMRGQIRGLDQASRNAQDGISLIQTAEGALNETHSILQRMRELAVQSATDTNTASDRAEIQKEIDQLATEVTRIANDTEFNTQKLLNGGVTVDGLGENTFHIGANAGQSLSVSINAMDAASLGVARDVVNFSAVKDVAADDIATVTVSENTGAGVVNGNISFTYAASDPGDPSTVTTSGDVFTITASTNNDAYNGFTVEIQNDAAAPANEGITVDYGTSKITIKLQAASTTNISGLGITVNGTNPGAGGFTFSGIADGTIAATANAGTTASGVSPTPATVTIDQGSVSQTLTIADDTATTLSVDSGAFKGISLALTNGRTVADLDGDEIVIDSTITEAKEAQFSGHTKTADAVASAGIDVSTKTAANSAITTIETAITTVSAERSKLGAVQNRLEHTINNLSTSSENLTASESRIRDVDMAKEMMEFTKNNILSQAAQAMLAQANQQPQGVLQLLR